MPPLPPALAAFLSTPRGRALLALLGGAALLGAAVAWRAARERAALAAEAAAAAAAARAAAAAAAAAERAAAAAASEAAAARARRVAELGPDALLHAVLGGDAAGERLREVLDLLGGGGAGPASASGAGGANGSVDPVLGLWPLHYAAQLGKADAVAALLRAGADANIRTQRTAKGAAGRTPLDFAQGSDEVAALLKAAGGVAGAPEPSPATSPMAAGAGAGKARTPVSSVRSSSSSAPSSAASTPSRKK